MSQTKKKVLTDALALALATGSLDPVEVPTTQAADPAPVTEPDPAPAVVPAAAAPVVEAVSEGLAAYLKAEIATLKTSLADSQLANSALQAQINVYAADNVAGLKIALGNVVKRLSVPLNAVLVGIDNYNGAQLVGAYDELNAKLSAAMSPGAKASASSEPTAPVTVIPTAANSNPLSPAARIRTIKE